MVEMGTTLVRGQPRALSDGELNRFHLMSTSAGLTPEFEGGKHVTI
jgi:hypothetical protein